MPCHTAHFLPCATAYHCYAFSWAGLPLHLHALPRCPAFCQLHTPYLPFFFSERQLAFVRGISACRLTLAFFSPLYSAAAPAPATPPLPPTLPFVPCLTAMDPSPGFRWMAVPHLRVTYCDVLCLNGGGCVPPRGWVILPSLFYPSMNSWWIRWSVLF